MTKEAGIEEQTDPSSSPLGSIIGLIREILENGGRVALWQRRCGGAAAAQRSIDTNTTEQPPFTPRWTSFAFHPASMSSLLNT